MGETDGFLAGDLLGAGRILHVVVRARKPIFLVGIRTVLLAAGFEVTVSSGGLQGIPISGDVLLMSFDEWQLTSLEGWSAMPVLVVAPDVASASNALDEGADSAVSDDVGLDGLVGAIAAAASGLLVSSGRSEGPDVVRPSVSLSAEEHRILRTLASGGTLSQLAVEYSYGKSAISARVSELYRKLGAENRAQALVAAAHLGLLS